MKKALILTAYILFAATLSGCGNSSETVHEQVSAAAVTSAQTETAVTLAETETTAKSTETISDRRITRKEAIAAAVEHSGLYDTEIYTPDSTFDYEGDLPVIEVRFDTLYTYSCVCKVNAADGSIIDFKKYPYCMEPEEVIPPEKAEAIALEHAGLAASEVTFAETERVTDDVRDVYSVKFTCGGREYEYYIHSLRGYIIKYSPIDEEVTNQYGFLYDYGYLYDFDLDGIDEVFVFNFDQVNEIIIYKDNGNEYAVWGDSILFNSIHPEWFTVDNLTLYYDKSADNYFYVNEYDVWEKYFNYADIDKYLITESGLVKSNIAHCEFLYDEEIDFSVNTLLERQNGSIGSVSFNDLLHYHNDIDEYLNQYEKAEVITTEQLTSRPLSENNIIVKVKVIK